MSSAAPSGPPDMTTPSPVLTGISTIAVPVTDQDRTKRLFEELGFTTSFDADLGDGFRWIDLAPPDGGARIAVIASGPELPTGVDTGIRLVAPDARVAHARLMELGLQVGELLDWPTAPLMFSFEDFDGNRLYVAEPA
jgi:catechol 2,3-dioxygenase-like lactoylglutathione lyase family enzyme